MIHRSTQTVETQTQIVADPTASSDWKTLLKQSRIQSRELLEALGLDSHPLVDPSAEDTFELRVPKPYLDKIVPGDPDDPLLLQVLPQAQEHLRVEGYPDDPLEETSFSPIPGLIHKYNSRVLLIATQACAIHCRYCFRRNFPYEDHRNSTSQWQPALKYISRHPEVNEVILSGGDPLVLNNSQLKNLLTALENIENVKRIRIHSRLISSLPQRIDEELLNLLAELRVPVIMMLHTNHPNELDQSVAQKARLLRRAGVRLFNQTVLLRGINDDAGVLAQLSEQLFEMDVQPYYLFTLDKAHGTAHFDIPRTKAQSIYQELLGKLPGFLAPRLVSELPGRSSKTPISVENPPV